MRKLDLFNDYDTIGGYLCKELNQNKVFIGEKKNKVCRYCNKKQPEVTFKSIAHAIPEFIGNKSLFANDECDVCNKSFSKSIEDHFAKYLGAYRTIGQIKGKKGIPKYKDKEIIIEVNDKIEINLTNLNLGEHKKFLSSSKVELNQKQKNIKIITERQPYVPAAVFKCLVKMAVAIAPQKTLPELQHLTAWLRESEHKSETFPNEKLIVLEQFTPAPQHPYPGTSLFLLQRKSNYKDIPYLCFVLTFGHFVYQIVLPMPKQDRKTMKLNISMPLIPNPFLKEENIYGKPRLRVLDLSSCYKKNETITIEMKYKNEANKNNQIN